jgi:Pup amidohydrolase
MRRQVPKIVGADIELSNFILGTAARNGTGDLASRLLLDEISGIDSGVGAAAQAADWGRKYLPASGACVYIDSEHLEIALPETFSAFDYVAHWRAMLRLVRDAARRINGRMRENCRLHVLANCSDGLDNSYGSHLNILITREAWDDIMLRKAHYLEFLAAFQISSIIFTGQGKVGSERGRPPAKFQLSQRADFIQKLASLDTMVDRGVINTRDEAHCGDIRDVSDSALARLHVIFFDSTLCQIATLLRVGTMQMIVAMLEAGCIDRHLSLDDPLAALRAWSPDVPLAVQATLADGRHLTALELQMEFFEAASRFEAKGGFDGIVPHAEHVLALWEGTLGKLAARNLDDLSQRLDWVAKYRLLTGVLERNPGLSWQSRVLKQLDQMFADIDEETGPFWALERDGHVLRVVSEAEIERARSEPPDDTRAWTRAHLLRLAGDNRVDQVHWDRVQVKTRKCGSEVSHVHTVHLPEPFGATRAINEWHFGAGASLESVVDALQATDMPASITRCGFIPAPEVAQDFSPVRGNHQPPRRQG